MKPDIIYQNAFYVPSIDKYFVSTHVHELVKYTDEEGKSFFVDGGNEYFRCGGDKSVEDKIVRFGLTSSSRLKDIRDKLLWGSRGKDGKQPMEFRPIKSLTLSHLKNIKKNCPYASRVVKKVVEYWIKKKLKKK